MTIHLYARVSTDDKGQDPETQLLPLRAAHPGALEYVDRCSAVAKHRPEWERIHRNAKPGDTVVVWKLDRAFRSVRDFVLTVEELNARKIGFKSLTEIWDTTTPSGVFFATVMAALAQFERSLLSERTKAGMNRARANGKHVGRPRKIKGVQT